MLYIYKQRKGVKDTKRESQGAAKEGSSGEGRLSSGEGRLCKRWLENGLANGEAAGVMVVARFCFGFAVW